MSEAHISDSYHIRIPLQWFKSHMDLMCHVFIYVERD
uniref:Uncharacterized protein n=1 Tax=Rhizophora mucronata TaxID=61149 RepID=A0A2P2R0L6_RHIMU